VEWKPVEGRIYVNVLDHQLARISGMQLDHLGQVCTLIDEHKRNTTTKRMRKENGTISKLQLDFIRVDLIANRK